MSEPATPSEAESVRERTPEGDRRPSAGSLDERPEVPFHQLPSEGKVDLIEGMGCVIPSGSRLEIWSFEGKPGYQIRIRRPLEDGTQSLLKFGLSPDAARTLYALLELKLFPENAQNPSTP